LVHSNSVQISSEQHATLVQLISVDFSKYTAQFGSV